MTRTLWIGMVGLALAGCAAGDLPGHNHPDGVAADGDAPAATAAAAVTWRLKVAGAT